MSALQLNPLKHNDHVALVCPGSICLLPTHPKLASDYLKQYYELNACFDEHTTIATPAKKRAEILLDYLCDDKIKAIFSLRGGEGSADLIPELHAHQSILSKLSPKWFVGFSDITALLLYFSKYYKWPTLHASSPLCFALSKTDKNSEKVTMDCLFGRDHHTILSELTPLNKAANHSTDKITGELTGGCLSLLQISIKDIWEIETQDKIIFIEDIGEKAHKIIRTLKYFMRIGLFTRVKAIILGDFTCQPIGGEAAEQENNRRAILNALSYFASLQTAPVFYTTQFGHGKTNFPLMYCRRYQIIPGKENRFSLATVIPELSSA